MDITAPFLMDVGLLFSDMEPVRKCARFCLDAELDILRGGALDEARDRFLGCFEVALTRHAGARATEEFRRWISETYTHVPADRPNWEAYEWFFYEWSAHMRDGEDRAGCFDDPRAVNDAHYAFVRGPRVDLRIKESRKRALSAWDEKVFSSRGYTLVENAEVEEGFDPFGPLAATIWRHHFQQFWGYILPRLSEAEQERLWQAVLKRYDEGDSRRATVAPAQLNRQLF